MLKKNKLLFISFLILVNLLFVSLTTAFAAMIEVGASAESAYQTQGNCAHGDRVAGIYVTKFLDAITYDPWFGDPVATTSFNWHNEWAWESDLLPGGPVDTVDFMVFSGHGFGQGLHNVPYNSLHYYTLNSSTDFHPYGESYESLDAANTDSYEVWWGSGTNAKTKWVTTYSCNFLNTAGSYWASIMQGVHLVMGFGSVMWVNSDEGDYYGDRLREGAKVKDAFF